MQGLLHVKHQDFGIRLLVLVHDLLLWNMNWYLSFTSEILLLLPAMSIKLIQAYHLMLLASSKWLKCVHI